MTSHFSLIIIGISFVAGMLTILAPCVLPLLPIILGVSTKTTKRDHDHKALIIILSFITSVAIFSLLFQWLSKQFGIYQEDLIKISGWILLLLGLFIVFPGRWNWLMTKTGFEQKTGELVAKQKKGIWGEIAIGVILGPLLQSCSPLYAYLIATILPGNFVWGLVNIISYCLGMGLMLFIIVRLGQKAISKLRRAANPTGMFKKIVGAIIVLLGVMIITGFDKTIGLRLADYGLSFDSTNLEYNAIINYEDAIQSGN